MPTARFPATNSLSVGKPSVLRRSLIVISKRSCGSAAPMSLCLFSGTDSLRVIGLSVMFVSFCMDEVAALHPPRVYLNLLPLIHMHGGVQRLRLCSMEPRQ